MKKAANTLYSLFVLFLLVVLPPAAWAAPTITWSRESVARIMSPGFSGTEQVTFQSDTALSDVDLVVVPTLQAYLTVSPAHFSVIEAQTKYSVTLSLQIPADAQVNTWAEGTIHLVQGRKTVATPLQVSVGVEVDAVRQADPAKIVADGNLLCPSNEVLLILSSGSGLADAQQLASSFGGTIVGFIPSLNLYQVLTQTNSLSELNALIQSLNAAGLPFLEGATKNYFLDVPQSATASTDLENLVLTTNDAHFATAYSSVNTLKAWDFLRKTNVVGQRDVVVGLVDSGVDLTPARHPEFVGVNFGKTPLLAQTDALVGWEWCLEHGLCGHGTENAGIIGANNLSDPYPTNDPPGQMYQARQMNGILSGIPGYVENGQTRYTLEERNWNNLPDAYKSGPGSKDSKDITAILAFIDEIIAGGSRVVLLEFSGKGLDRLNVASLFRKMKQEEKDVLFVLPAGDDGVSVPKVTDLKEVSENLCVVAPGCISLPNTITVGAFDPSLDPSKQGYRLDNFGPAVDVSGPGKHIYAPQPPTFWNLYSSYTDSFGDTSGAAPFIAGTAALIWAVRPQTPSPEQLKDFIVNDADPIPASLEIGNRLNICRSVKKAVGADDPPKPQLLSPPENPPIPLNTSTSSGPTYNVYFNWSDVSADSCNEITGYDLEIRVGGEFYSGSSVKSPGTSFNLVISSPPSLTGWTWTVTAVDEYGNKNSPPTIATGTFSLQAVSQAAVTTLPASAINVGTATLNGSGNPNGLATTGWFEWGPDPSLSAPNTTGGQSIGSGSTAVGFSANLYGLEPDTTYYFRAVMANSAGTSKGSILSFKTLAAVAPAVSTGVTTGVTSSETIFNGQLNPNGALSNGWFEYGTSSTLATYTSTPQQSVSSDNTSHPFSSAVGGLSPGVTYYYRAVGSNAGGTTRGSIVSFVAASAPGGVITGTATSLTSSSAVLNGTVNPAGSPGIAYFQYGTSSSFTFGTYYSTPSQAVTADQTTQTFTATVGSLGTNTTYYCRIVFGDSGNGSTQYGNVVSFSTLASTEITLQPSSVTSSSAVLNGTVNPAGSPGIAYFQYGTSSSFTFGTYYSTPSQAVTADQTTQTFTATVGSLGTNTTYYCRIVFGDSGNGSTQYGNVVSFSTQ